MRSLLLIIWFTVQIEMCSRVSYHRKKSIPISQASVRVQVLYETPRCSQRCVPSLPVQNPIHQTSHYISTTLLFKIFPVSEALLLCFCSLHWRYWSSLTPFLLIIKSGDSLLISFLISISVNLDGISRSYSSLDLLQANSRWPSELYHPDSATVHITRPNLGEIRLENPLAELFRISRVYI